MRLDIRPVAGARDLRRFVDVPWRILDRASHPQWTPPLRLMVHEALDARKNHFWRRAERALWIAERDGHAVGRIAAIENRAHNDFHEDRVGFFGFFECADDQDAAAALLDTASGWLAARGLTSMRGPVSPSTNHECGLLVDGFDAPPMFLTTWNPRYYVDLLERAGLSAAKDLLGFWLPMDDPSFALPSRYAAHAERARETQQVRFRDLDARRWNDEVALCWEVYNSAWEPNWGFVPMEREEFVQMAEGLKFLIWPHFAFAAEVNGEPAGFCLVLPDYGEVLRAIGNGRLLPTGLVRLLLGKRRLKRGRVMALGVRPEFRTAGIYALFAHELYVRGRALGAVGGEASWILEDNDRMLRPLRAIGAREYRRWRLYERPVG